VVAMADDNNAVGETRDDTNYTGGDDGINDGHDIDMREPGSDHNGGGRGGPDFLALVGEDDGRYGGGGPGRAGGPDGTKAGVDGGDPASLPQGPRPGGDGGGGGGDDRGGGLGQR
jgi:hypothetical protein